MLKNGDEWEEVLTLPVFLTPTRTRLDKMLNRANSRNYRGLGRGRTVFVGWAESKPTAGTKTLTLCFRKVEFDPAMPLCDFNDFHGRPDVRHETGSKRRRRRRSATGNAAT